MFRTGFGRSGEGATGPDSGTWKGARNRAFCKGWESFLERVFSERKEGCRFVLHRVRRRGEEGNVRMECREVLFSLPSDGKGHSPEFSLRSEGVWNIGRESSSTCFQRGLGFGFRIRVRVKKTGPWERGLEVRRSGGILSDLFLPGRHPKRLERIRLRRTDSCPRRT